MLIQCAQPSGYAANVGDCDDADPANYPGNVELCDGQDNDCNSLTSAGDGETDDDSDGIINCADCDDADPANYPGNVELCDGQDNDCNGLADADVAGEVDADSDTSLSCEIGRASCRERV